MWGPPLYKTICCSSGRFSGRVNSITEFVLFPPHYLRSGQEFEPRVLTSPEDEKPSVTRECSASPYGVVSQGQAAAWRSSFCGTLVLTLN